MSTTNPTIPWQFPLCPSPPDWVLDWPSLSERWDWVQAMDGVLQDPVYHAEGDVLVHTRMVAEVLMEMDEWRRRPNEERSTLFAAALLHDVAKPLCTRVEVDGAITSRNHARRGELMTRELLWRGIGPEGPVPFACRESIARLVRFHGLPLWFLEKPSPARAVIEASQTVRMDQVALLAEADALGRRCADQEELLGRVALFREFCRESQCYERPRAFASDHTRFRFFRHEWDDPDHAAYDDTRFEVILMAGLPGAGKDTWIRANLPEWPVLSLDQIRREMRVGPGEPQGRVAQKARERAREWLRARRSFVWNATNITRSTRRSLIDLVVPYGAWVRIVYVEAPWDRLLQRNRSRPDAVPESVIHALAAKIEVPDLTEAHAVVWVLDGLPAMRKSVTEA